MIGCQEAAELAYYEKTTGRNRRFLDSGSFRYAYKIGSCVYKVCKSRDVDGVNLREYAFFIEHQDMSWSPEVDLYHVENRPIVCMPYFCRTSNERYETPHELIEESRRCLRRYIDRTDARCMLSRCPGCEQSQSDVHAGNYRIDDDGHYWLIDGGGS